MSSDDTSVKGGHAAAVKAGGMRIVQHKQTGAAEAKAASPPKEDEDAEEYGSSPPKPDTHHQSILLSGAVTKGDKDFTTEAVKHIHEKPVPVHEKRPNVQQQHHINQPRKQ